MWRRHFFTNLKIGAKESTVQLYTTGCCAWCEGVSVEPSRRRQSLESLPADVPWYRSCRIVLAFITAWGYVFFYLLRIDLSLAIVCMVRDPDTAAAAAAAGGGGGHDNSSTDGIGNASIATVRLLVHRRLKEMCWIFGVKHACMSDRRRLLVPNRHWTVSETDYA